MISSLLNFLSDTSFQLRAGKITYSLPARRLYRIAPYNEPTGVAVYATPLESYTQSTPGIIVSKSYSIGEDVIYIENATENGSTGLLFGIIIGAIPVGTISTDGLLTNEKVSSALSGSGDGAEPIDEWYEKLAEDVAKTFQLSAILGSKNFGNNRASGAIPGDYDVVGASARLHVDDVSAHITAGNAGIFLNSAYDMLDVVSPLFRKVSAGTFEQLFLINDNFFHIAMRGLTARETYSKGRKPIFRNIEEFSNYVYGKKSSILDVSGLEISSIDQQLDGTINISATNGVLIEKTVRVKKTLIPKNYPIRAKDDAEIYSRDSIRTIGEDESLWDILDQEPDNDELDVLPPPLADESISYCKNYSEFSDGVSEERISYAKAKASIRTLPTGGILIRDAWGSEIRMEGGNVQISAANNIANVGGRDILNLCSGVFSTNAGESIQLGAANKSVDILGGTGVTVSAKTNAIRLIGDSTSIETSQLNADVSMARLKSSLTIVGGDRFVINSNELIAHASTASISGNSSGLVLGDGAILGASSFVVNGHLSVRRGGLKISDIPTTDGGSDTVNSPRGGCSLTVDGRIATTGEIAASQQIVTAEGVYAKSAAIQANGVGKLKYAPNKVKIDDNEPLEYSISNISEAISKFIERFNKMSEKAVFTIRSKACAVWQPLFAKASGKRKMPVAADVDENYIYPGEAFWEKEGLLLNDKVNEDKFDPDYEYEKSGAKSLMLNTQNIEERDA